MQWIPLMRGNLVEQGDIRVLDSPSFYEFFVCIAELTYFDR